MNEQKSKLLLAGDQVITDKLPPGEIRIGLVEKTSRSHVKIKWDDEELGIIDHRDMGKIDFHGDDKKLLLRNKRIG